jgi:hypothetical protein
MEKWVVRLAALGLGTSLLAGCTASAQVSSASATPVWYAEACEAPHRSVSSRASCSGFAASSLADRLPPTASEQEMGSAYAMPEGEVACSASTSLASRATCGGYAALPVSERR